MDDLQQKPGVVGLCITQLHQEFEYELYQNLREELGKNGYRLLIFYAISDFYIGTKNDTGESSVFSLIPYEKLDALIVVFEAIKDEKIRRQLMDGAKSAGIPLISVNYPMPDCCNVVFDYAAAMEQIVRHVIRVHGCRRVNFLAGFKGNSFSEERLAIYKSVLEEEGIPVEEKRIGYGDFWSIPARKAAEQFLQDEEWPQAIICANDSMAIAVCQLLKEKGIRVPEDIIVTGLDGIEFERYHTPRLTTAAADMPAAAETVIEIIRAYKRGYMLKENYVIHHKVRFSESCGCIPKGEQNCNQQMQYLYDQIYRMSAFEQSMSNMVAEVTSSHNLESAVTRFERYIDEFSLDDISIYLTENFTSENAPKENIGVFQKWFEPIVNKRDGRYVSLPAFPVKSLSPDLDRLMEKGDPLLFLPLHFQDVVLALLMFRVPEGFRDFRLLKSFHISLNHTLGLLQSQEVLRLALEKMKIMTSHDYLTGILNRSGFFAGAAKLIREGSAHGKQLWMFSIDLNGLKGINDIYGHHEGDFALKKVAQAMSACAEQGTLCARFGGDEFSVCGLADDPKEACEQYLSKVKAYLEEFNATKQKPYPVQASFGWSSEAAAEHMNLDLLIRKADEQMYEDKRRSHRHRSVWREEH